MKDNFKVDFPLLKDSDIIYLDSGATSQKPKCVLDEISAFYKQNNANPYRGAYELSVRATTVYNDARRVVANFLNAKEVEEIIFTKNATESLNLLAYSYGMDNIKQNEKIVLSIMEHHSNLVPWQGVAKVNNAKLEYMYVNDNFEIPYEEIENKITEGTKIVGICSVSNVLGTVNDVDRIIKKAHSVGAVVVVDVSQSIAHSPFDVQKTDADFVVFSAHKMFGPLGVGVLYGKRNLLENMKPFLMGGDMIEYVYEQETTFAPLPHKFEAGTQNASGVAGLACAIKYIQKIGYEQIIKIEKEVLYYAYDKLKELKYIELLAPKKDNLSSVISFNVKGVHPHDVASILDSEKVCVRAGNHCAQPLMRFLGIDSTVRVSFSIYNSKEDVDKLISALNKVYNMFKKYIKVED